VEIKRRFENISFCNENFVLLQSILLVLS